MTPSPVSSRQVAQEAPETSQDSLLNGAVSLRQPKSGYRVAVDPVFLAAAVPLRAGQNILDAGCGVGAVALCLAHRARRLEPGGVRISALEVEPALAELARQNVADNSFEETVFVETGDILAPPQSLGRGSFDQLVMNPPYMEEGAADIAGDPGRRQAHVEGPARLESWIAFAHDMLRVKGRLTLIHRADRMDAILACLYGKFGEITLFPLWPGQGKAAKRILVSARKGVSSAARMASGLVLHDPSGDYSDAAREVLHGRSALDLDE